MKVINKANLPDAVEFIEAELSQYDTSKIDWFKLLPLSKQRFFHGYCRYPKRKKKRSRSFLHGYQIRCSVNVNPHKWPHSWDMATSTWQKEIDGIKHWGYNHEYVCLKNPNEAAVYIAGHEAYHFLRHSKQVPGRNSEVQADKFGLRWLEDFRVLEWDS